MRIPLKNQLRGSQAALASLQDEALDIFYALEPESVLHGGTAIWRCYGGKRFSEDLDFYAMPREGFRERLFEEAKKRTLSVTKFRKTQRNIYAKISDGRSEVSLEVSLRTKGNRILGAFERADGTHADIYTLSTENLMLEKADAFYSRKLIRDIYDVYFLSNTADIVQAEKALRQFLGNLPEPVDEKNLRTLIYSGPVPSFAEMADALRRRIGK